MGKKVSQFGAIGLIGIVAILVMVAGFRLTRPVPMPWLTSNVVTAARQPSPVRIQWPAVREGAVAVEGLGPTWTTGSETAEYPMASITKMMTAYLILRDHPLSGDEQGPSIPVTKADVKAYKSAVKAGDSGAKVAAGEMLTERQALEALMLPSADNIAWLLAAWDAGSPAAFAAKENVVARSLGMGHTDYTDPSGLSPSTVSTALDQMKLVRAAMRNQVFAQIAAMPYAVIPVAGTVVNYNRQTGLNGIVGIKTGTTSQAGACWAFAIKRTVGGAVRTVYGVVFGAPLSPGNQQALAAIEDGESLADAMTRTVSRLTVLPAGTTVGQITIPWSKTQVPVVTARALSGMALAGAHITLNARAGLPPAGTQPAGITVGSASASGFFGPAATTPVVTAGPMTKPSLTWKLFG